MRIGDFLVGLDIPETLLKITETDATYFDYPLTHVMYWSLGENTPYDDREAYRICVTKDYIEFFV